MRPLRLVLLTIISFLLKNRSTPDNDFSFIAIVSLKNESYKLILINYAFHRP